MEVARQGVLEDKGNQQQYPPGLASRYGEELWHSIELWRKFRQSKLNVFRDHSNEKLYQTSFLNLLS